MHVFGTVFLDGPFHYCVLIFQVSTQQNKFDKIILGIHVFILFYFNVITWRWIG